MKAVILAAGEGRRMNNPDGPPKILLDLYGQTLLEHHLNALSSLGVTEFVIVTGRQCNAIEQYAERKRLFRRFNLSLVANDRWPEGNGSSILAAQACVNEDRFLVVMGDHLFDPESLRGFLKVRGEFVGVFDSEPRYVDTNEATKAASRHGYVVALGKELAEFKYVDTGMFICAPRLFPFIEQCLAEGQGTFNEVKRRWIASGNILHIFDCRGAFWMDVDTEEDLVKARKVVRNRLIKPRDGWVARYLNRPLSTRLSPIIARTSATPNQISLVVFSLGVLAAHLFAQGEYSLSVAGGMLAQMSSVLDGVDGEVARLKFRASPYGSWLDSVLDRWADALLIFGVVYGSWKVIGSAWIWMLGFLALAGSLILSYTESRYESSFHRAMPHSGSRLPATRDVRLFLIMIGGLAYQLPLALAAIGILSTAEVLRRLVSGAKDPQQV